MAIDRTDYKDDSSPRGPQKKTTLETRQKIIELFCSKNCSVKDICETYNLSDSTVRYIIKRFAKEDRVEYKSRGGSCVVKLNAQHNQSIIQMTDDEDERNIVSIEDILNSLKLCFPLDFPKSFHLGQRTITVNTIKNHIKENVLISVRRIGTPTMLPKIPNGTLPTGYDIYVSTLKSTDASYLHNCVFMGQATYNTYMVPVSARTRKGKKYGHLPLQKVKHRVMVKVMVAFDTNGILLLKARLNETRIEESHIMVFTETLFKMLDKKYKDPQHIIMSNIQQTMGMTDLFFHSKHRSVILPLSLQYMLDPTEPFFSKLPLFVNREHLAPDEGLLERLDAVKDYVPNENCRSWINGCSVISRKR